jgi:hypothetical protein
MFSSKFVGKKKQMEVQKRKTEAMTPFKMDSRPRL